MKKFAPNGILAACFAYFLTISIEILDPESMTQLHNKNIVLGVSGGIAAYKSADLVRQLLDRGACTKVVMTKAATEFITPLTMQALSGNSVHLDLLDTEAEAAMGHIELARWADLILVAPASADFMAKVANGQADDLLTTLCLATSAPLALAPAMNKEMWADASTQHNLQLLQGRGVNIIGPDEGSQACGDIGPGRMVEPTAIAEQAGSLFETGVLSGLSVVITAGPTREPIDPVRYISNYSSGKMGFAIAQAAIDAGAKTTLISGPVNLETPEHAQRINVESAAEMHSAALKEINHCDIFIAAAAVADYRVSKIAEKKIKKQDQKMVMQLVRNQDIVADIANASPRPFTVGFAAETHNVINYARDKMARKNLDMIVANDVSDATIGFNSDDNAATILWKEGSEQIERISKYQLAGKIISNIAKRLNTVKKREASSL